MILSEWLFTAVSNLALCLLCLRCLWWIPFSSCDLILFITSKHPGNYSVVISFSDRSFEPFTEEDSGKKISSLPHSKNAASQKQCYLLWMFLLEYVYWPYRLFEKISAVDVYGEKENSFCLLFLEFLFGWLTVFLCLVYQHFSFFLFFFFFKGWLIVSNKLEGAL